MKYITLFLVIIYSTTGLTAQSLEKIDSLRQLPLNAEKVDAFFSATIDFLIAGRPEADALVLEGLEMARELDDPVYLGQYHVILSIAAFNEGRFRDSDSLLGVAGAQSLLAGDSVNYNYVQVQRISSLIYAGLYGTAMQRGINLIPELESQRDTGSLMELRMRLTEGAILSNDFERALTYVESAFAHVATYPHYGPYYLNNLRMLRGVIMARTGREAAALDLYAAALVHKDGASDVQNDYTTYLRRAELYLERDDLGAVRRDLDSARVLGDLTHDYWLIDAAWLQKNGRFGEARGVLHRALAMLRDEGVNNGDAESSIYRLLQYDDLSGPQYDTAAHYGKLMVAALDSTIRQTNAATVLDLETQYETREKDRRIATQDTALTAQRRTQNLTYGILGLAALALVGLFFGLRKNRRKNALLAVQNDRNELLLKEIHHRVKNNLETVSSLLELQSASLTDEHAVSAMRAGQSRVRSMGLLHQKLYQGENLAAIEMKDYFTNLAESLEETYEPDDDILITVAMEPLEMDVDTAVPLGLIVNELLTNALKYAFVGAGAGAVTVGLSRVNTNEYRLTVRDDGVGKDFAAGPQGTGFGSRLVELLTRQIGGALTEVNDGGLRTELRFAA
ncbi:sensor histidine kinase [Neolewinella antarctica]|uniref:histidine kinase n=1 Tax=Neolewinella antarctica TaxID=442734 RepID=A0ABX0XFF0_9BACT|nr:sensor histidine kinase [Neolewinella antarctica]NJC28044.1 two-component sensor histidine kinase [Neolewinella antarctica]